MADISREQLESYRGRKRVLLIFAPSSAHKDYLMQRGLLVGAEDGLRERDLLALYLFANRSGEEHALRDRFKIANDAFAVVLIGKDGGEKERFLEAVQPTKLFGLVDQMPMRRRELKDAQR